MDGIRDWLVACGATFGCTEVHHYRWADASTRPEVPYLTYKAVRLTPDPRPIRGAQTSGITGEEAHTVLSESSEQFQVVVQVDLYNSEFGMGWLAKAGVAAEKEQAIKNIFHHSNVGFKEVIGVEDYTEIDDDEDIRYHQRLTAIFRTVVTHVHKNYQYKVDTIVTTGATVFDEE
jgi:hypothetical protein